MEVTEIKVVPVHEETLKAYVTVTFYDCFIIRGLKIINGNKGLFVAMPSQKMKDGTFRDIAHPLNQETRAMIESRILEEYNREIARSSVREERRDLEY